MNYKRGAGGSNNATGGFRTPAHQAGSSIPWMNTPAAAPSSGSSGQRSGGRMIT